MIVAILSAGVVFCVAEVDAEWEIEWPFLEAENPITVPCGVNYTGQYNTSHNHWQPPYWNFERDIYT